jgi:hypothetical protein
VSDFLAFRLNLLREKFPNATAYFESQGYIWPVIDSLLSPPPQFPDDLELKSTDEPLLAQPEVAEDIKLLNRMTAHPADGKALLVGLETGRSAYLQMPRVPPIPGVIGKITNDYVEFAITNGKTMNISFRAMELKYASITIE